MAAPMYWTVFSFQTVGSSLSNIHAFGSSRAISLRCAAVFAEM